MLASASKAGQPQNDRFINSCQFGGSSAAGGRPIQWLVESQWPFYQAPWPLYQGQWPLYQGRINRFIKAKWPQWPFYQPEAGDLGCGWPISYCPAQAVYQRPNGRFIKAGQPQWPWCQSRWAFYQGRQAPVAVLSIMTVVSRPANPMAS